MKVQKSAVALTVSPYTDSTFVDRLDASRAVNKLLWSVCTPKKRSIRETTGLAPRAYFP